MIYRTIFVALFLGLASAGLANAQDNTCKATLAELPSAPELFGFHMGMTQDQIKVQVPQVKFGPKNEFGISKTSISPDFDPRFDKNSFTDVRTISFDFLDGQLTSLWIGFEGTFKWKTPEEFVKGISHELKLPDAWTTKGRAQQLTCSNFQLSVTMIAGGPSLRIIDLPAEETIAARRQAKEDEAESPANAPEQTAVIGDTRKKVYYQKDCDALKAVPEKIRILFDSDKDAEKAGYKRAQTCP
ncbi:MAG: hypothetical protein M3R68_09595 [Acidobacteriota bacterium]|nr:hypothetical protein [Acidobacteriota bacterium]